MQSTDLSSSAYLALSMASERRAASKRAGIGSPQALVALDEAPPLEALDDDDDDDEQGPSLAPLAFASAGPKDSLPPMDRRAPRVGLTLTLTPSATSSLDRSAAISRCRAPTEPSVGMLAVPGFLMSLAPRANFNGARGRDTICGRGGCAAPGGGGLGTLARGCDLVPQGLGQAGH